MATSPLKLDSSGLDIQWTLQSSLAKSAGNEVPPVRLLHIVAKPTSSFHETCSKSASLNRLSDLALLDRQALASVPAKHLLENLSAYIRDERSEPMTISYVLPYASGWMIRSDFLDIRLKDLHGLTKVDSFVKPLQYCYLPGHEDLDQTYPVDLLETAVGAATFHHATKDAASDEALCVLSDLFRQRLSYPWLSTEPLYEKRVALVRGRPSLKVGWRVYQAAKALGVSLVIVDDDGHWLQEDTGRNRDLREAFLPVNMAEDSRLADRLVDALEAYPLPIHGLFTLSDNFLVHVARAAEQMRLPTSPSLAHEIAVDKHLSRGLQAQSTQYTRANSANEVQRLIDSGDFAPKFPLIIKPRTRGWSSNYVFKASNIDELLHAVGRICPHYEGGVLVEPYYDGPEIDVNFVLLGGKPLFREIVDELPSKGDLEEGISADFLESGMMVPTILPEEEKDSIYSSMLDILTRLGFLTGVFHVEARLARSRMEYKDLEGTVDLVAKDNMPSGQVECHLIEINARPPGLVSEIVTSHTFGVDYFAARILSAVGDDRRLETICKPFNTNLPNGAQYWSQLVFPPIPQGSFLLSRDPFDELVQRCPDLAAHISDSKSDFAVGDILPDPDDAAAAYIGHCMVVSREGRRDMMMKADRIRKELRIE